MAEVIVVTSGKGGVGKTTTSAAFATGLAQRGKKTVVHIDLSRPRRGVWVATFANLPGYSIENGAHMHALLPGWQYTADEVWAETR